MKTKRILLVSILCLVFAISNIATAGLHRHYLKYHIKYHVKSSGFFDWFNFPLSGKIDQVLKRNQDGTWLLERSGLIYGFKAREISRFRLTGSIIQPIWYLRNQTGVFKDNYAEINFPRGNKTLFDPITLSLRIALDLQKNPNKKEFSYTLSEETGEEEEHIYVVTGREVIHTPAGDIDTVVIARQGSEEFDKEFTFWLAPELDYSIARSLTLEKGEVKVEIEIKGGTIGTRKL